MAHDDESIATIIPCTTEDPDRIVRPAGKRTQFQGRANQRSACTLHQDFARDPACLDREPIERLHLGTSHQGPQTLPMGRERVL